MCSALQGLPLNIQNSILIVWDTWDRGIEPSRFSDTRVLIFLINMAKPFGSTLPESSTWNRMSWAEKRQILTQYLKNQNKPGSQFCVDRLQGIGFQRRHSGAGQRFYTGTLIGPFPQSCGMQSSRWGHHKELKICSAAGMYEWPQLR